MSIHQALIIIIVFTDHPDNHRLRRQDAKDVDGADAVRGVRPPRHLLLCLASCKLFFFYESVFCNRF